MASRRHEDQRPRNECQDDQEVSQLEAGYVQEQTAPSKKRGVRTLLHRNGPQLRHRFLRIAAVQRRTQSNRGRADPGYLSRCEHSVSRPLCRGQIAEGAIRCPQRRKGECRRNHGLSSEISARRSLLSPPVTRYQLFGPARSRWGPRDASLGIFGTLGDHPGMSAAPKINVRRAPRALLTPVLHSPFRLRPMGRFGPCAFVGRVVF